MDYFPKTSQELIDVIGQANAANGGNIYLLENGSYSFSSADNDENALPKISSDITIYGNGASLVRTGSSQFRFLELIDNARLSLHHLILDGGHSPGDGGAIIASDIGGERLELTDCEFINNVADGRGGAIYIDLDDENSNPLGSLIIENCLFDNNQADNQGGAISLESGDGRAELPIRIRGSRFTNNQADYGAAIHIFATNLNRIEFEASHFSSNQANAGAGAIEISHGNAYLTACEFIENTTVGDFGALFFHGNAHEIIVLGSCFEANEAEDRGAGALGAERIELRNCVIINNVATDPGGIPGFYLDADELIMSGNEVSGNNNPNDPNAPAMNLDGNNDIDASNNNWNGQYIKEDVGAGAGGMQGSAPLEHPRELGSSTDPRFQIQLPIHEGGSDCICPATDSPEATGNPIALWTAEKRWQDTAIRLQTALGSLEFRYSYQQSRQADRDFMGRGWTHNHWMQLHHDTSGSPNEISIETEVNKSYYLKTEVLSASLSRFQGAAGSFAYVDYDSNLDEYTLVTPDKSEYRFAQAVTGDSTRWLLSERKLANGQSWYYHYDSGKLSLVHDDPAFDGSDESAIRWALRFAWYDTSDYRDGKLWRVGILETDSLTTSPDGPYIEFDYAELSTVGVFLSRCRDLLDYSRCYRYGFQEGETDALLKTYLYKRVALLDVGESDCSSSAHIVEESLEYTLDGSNAITQIIQERGDGLLQKQLDFEAESTIEMVPNFEDYAIEHEFTNGVFTGTKDALGQKASQELTARYRRGKQIDRNGAQSLLQWSGDGKRLEAVQDALYQETRFSYDPLDRLLSSIDAEGRLSFYDYEGSYREPRQILQTNGSNLLTDAAMETTDQWPNLGTPLVNQRWPHAAMRYARYVKASAASQGIESISKWNATSGKTYILRARVYIVSGSVTLRTPGFSGLSVNSNGTGWKNLEVSAAAASNLSDLVLQVIANGTAAEFYLKQARVFEDDGTDVVRLPIQGDLMEDAYWQSISGAVPQMHEDLQRQRYSGGFARYLKTDAADEGLENSQTLSLISGRTYQLFAFLRPISGTLQIRLRQGSTTLASASSSGTGDWQALSFAYTASSNLSAKLQVIASGSAAEGFVDEIFLFDNEIILRQQAFDYNSRRQLVSEQLLNPKGLIVLDETEHCYDDAVCYSGSAASRGLLWRITRKDMLALNDVLTTYLYDDFGRVRQTQKTNQFGTCEFNYSVLDAKGQLLASICNYEPGSNPVPTTAQEAADLYDAINYPNKNQVTSHVYDALGRRVQTTTNAGAPFARSSYAVFDSLGRVTLSIGNYKSLNSSSVAYDAPETWHWDAMQGRWEDGSGLPIEHGGGLDENLISQSLYNHFGQLRLQRDVLGRVTLHGYNRLGHRVASIQNALTPAYNNDYINTDPDPSLENYPLSTSQADGDMLSRSFYDALGNLVESIDVLGNRNWSIYDALNRPVKTIRNPKDEASLSLNPGDEGYLAANDPRSEVYLPSLDPDRDLISTSEYDVLGRVIRTKQLMENRAGAVWDTMLYGYDELGRQVRSIQHASQPDYDLAADPDLSEYSLSSDADQDLLSESRYDEQGRVIETIDLSGRTTRLVYDGLNHQLKTILNYVEQGSSLPENWLWANNQWEDGASNPIDHGSNNDQNIISETIYDSDGRVQASRNVEGLLSRSAYDDLGRQALSVQNYVPQGGSDPVDWEWDPGQERWEDGANNAVSRGTGFDQNIISQPSYDLENRVFQTRDARGNLNYQVFDDTGRLVMSIQNYVEQGSSDPVNWLWDESQQRWEDGAGNPIQHGSNKDQNRIQTSQYDLLGRVFRSRDALGRESYMVFDVLGRVIRRIQNYVVQGSTLPDNWLWDEAQKRWEDGAGNAIDHGSEFDQNILSETAYNQAGQVISSRDARGTLTVFVYDAAGRRLMTTQAEGTPLVTANYTCFDKAGRVLRQIASYAEILDENDEPISPDAWDLNGDWLFAPGEHGAEQDINLISESIYDRASRRIQSIDPMGNISSTSYSKDGQVETMTDPEDMVTAFVYDALRRRRMVVQNYIEQGSSDPVAWLWTNSQWEDGASNAIEHGINNDENIIVQLNYDIAGRVLEQREPRGNLTSYTYDKLGRRTSLTNPLSKVWETTYSEANGATQTSMDYPNVYTIQHDFDRFGRLLELDYGSAANTPTVNFAYDLAGNRLGMTENDGTSDIRITGYHYDRANRLKQLDFDTDADTVIEETLSYAYDLGGLRTRLTMPGDLDISYTYDAKGRLISLKDWAEQTSRFSYDKANRHNSTQRPNGLKSRYLHDAAGRLALLRHTDKHNNTLAEFAYTVDGRGNRTQAREVTKAASVSTKVYAHTDEVIQYIGAWTNAGTQHETTKRDARLGLAFLGNTSVELLIGTGPNHSIFDVYLDGTLYESCDAYAASAGSRQLDLALEGDGWHVLELRNRPEKNLQSTGYKLAFQSLSVDTALQLTTIDYLYDGLSRLLEANYNNDETIYSYGYDVSGNLVNNNGVSRTYNEANQMTDDGTNTLSYDDNGNLLDDGVNTWTWDGANRLLSVDDTSYKYDGAGNRIQQTVSSVVTDYLNDLQPGLVKLLAQTTGSDIQHYIHAPRGIFAMEDASGWDYMLQDGLGSVRNEGMSYEPYGKPLGSYSEGFGFTGEYTDINDLLYLRARYYAPEMGLFTALDPFEGTPANSRSLNRYNYVWGNPTNRADASGMCPTMTLETTRNAIQVLKAAYPDLASVDGALPDAVANIVCTAQDFGQNAPQIIAVGSATVEVAVTIIGTGALATAGLVLAVGALFGVGFYLATYVFPPVPYRPDQLDDMRPPVPQEPIPTTATAPRPNPQPTLAPSPSPIQTPCGTPTAVATLTETPTSGPNMVFYRGNTYYDLLRTQNEPIEDVIRLLTSRQTGRDIDQGVFYTSINRDVALYFAFLETGNRPGQGGAGLMTIELENTEFQRISALYGVVHNNPVGGLPPQIPQPHVETLFPFTSLPDLFTVSQISVELIPT